MKYYLFCVAIVFAACQQESNQPAPLSSAKRPAERVEAALITNNQLPADGCEAHVQIHRTGAGEDSLVIYKPSAETLSVLEKALDTGKPGEFFWGQKAVTIKFRETGKRVDLACGMTIQVVSEIEVLDITK